MTRDDMGKYKAQKELEMELEAAEHFVTLANETPPNDLRQLAIKMADYLEEHEVDNYAQWCVENDREADQLRKNLDHIYAVAALFLVELYKLEKGET